MKPILDKKKSKIVSFGPKGWDLPLPKSAEGDLKRIRFDGTNLVDLATLSHIYVAYENNAFELHAREVANSQLVAMKYEDRRRLKYDAGIIDLKSVQDLRDDLIAKLTHRARSRAKIAMEKQMGLLVEQFMFNQRLMFVLLWALRTQNAQGLQFVDDYIAEMQNIFDITDPDFKADLIADYKKIRNVIKDYYDELEGI
jgi:hypothetical protein